MLCDRFINSRCEDATGPTNRIESKGPMLLAEKKKNNTLNESHSSKRVVLRDEAKK